MKIETTHHVAYRCHAAKESILWHHHGCRAGDGRGLRHVEPREFDAVTWHMREGWRRTKRAAKRAAFRHAKELSTN